MSDYSNHYKEENRRLRQEVEDLKVALCAAKFDDSIKLQLLMRNHDLVASLPNAAFFQKKLVPLWARVQGKFVRTGLDVWVEVR